jgi:hypothetical protein
VIRSYPGEHAYIDGSLLQFRTLRNEDWQPAREFDQTAHEDEYVSRATFPEGVDDPDKVVNRGAFLDRNPYTRLITYSNLNDFRATNETFEKMTDYPDPDPRPGPRRMEQCPADDQDPECVLYQDGKKYRPAKVQVECVAGDQDPNCLAASDGKHYKFLSYRFPWVYMGPGIWFNRDPSSPTAGRVHIRLSHTSNQIDGLADYQEETDPRNVKLAISPKDLTTLQVRGSSYLRFEHLTIRYGGEYSIFLRSVENIVFDHVRIRAAGYGVRMGGEASNPTTNTIFRHCEFNGGMPTWYFRSDRKAEYDYDNGGAIAHNNLGKQTVDTLLLGNPNDDGTQISHCEFRNAHDVYLVGANLTFHHNWINNLNDEGLFLDAYANALNMRIFQNVIVKTLSAISFAGARDDGHWYIYRNLIDLRRPTAGFRPRRPGHKDVWRYGHLHKSNAPDGPHDLFQNTILVYAQAAQASFMHYRDTSEKSGNHARRSFNNLFLAVNPDSASDRAITFIQSPSFPAQTDGNDYYRIGIATNDAYRFLAYTFDQEGYDGGTFADLDELRRSTLFTQSKRQYLPGYEANSIEQNPQFLRIGADGRERETDDLRLSDASPALQAGIKLPDELQALDPIPPSSGNPDIGCYPHGSGPLEMGIDGRRSYPMEPT